MAKKQSGQKKKRVIFVLIIAILVLAALPTIQYLYLKSGNSVNSDHKNSSTNSPIDKRPDVDGVKNVKGKVTLIQDSCGYETLDSSGGVARHPGACDSSLAIMIDDKIKVFTSTGAAAPDFHVDTSNVSLGDTVSVKYVADETYGASLNCSECSVVVTKRKK